MEGYESVRDGKWEECTVGITGEREAARDGELQAEFGEGSNGFCAMSAVDSGKSSGTDDRVRSVISVQRRSERRGRRRREANTKSEHVDGLSTYKNRRPSPPQAWPFHVQLHPPTQPDQCHYAYAVSNRPSIPANDSPGSQSTVIIHPILDVDWAGGVAGERSLQDRQLRMQREREAL